MFANSFVVPNDMSDLCRVCLQLPEESQFLDLTTIYDEEDNLTYADCFTICTQIDLNAGEGLPHQLCKSCGLELQVSYDFHKKVEESKRVIEQCQRHIKLEKTNDTELCSGSKQSKDLSTDKKKKRPMVKLIDEKYAIIEEEQLAGQSQEREEDCVMQGKKERRFVAHSDVDSERDVLDVINNISDTKANAQYEAASYKNNSSVETMNENIVQIDVVHHSEMDDYQNLEALEEEETETLQIKCGENTIPVYITKLKTCESEENEEFVEYTEVYNEEEEEREDVDREYAQEANEESTEDHSRWQENVVAVANKEHLPIEIEDDEENEEDETSKSTNNESRVTAIECSQEEALENEDEANEELCTETNTNANKNTYNTARKRHVGSYSCDYCNRVYPNYSRMKTHRRCHEADRPKFSCSHCGRMYATKQARDCHIQTAHDKSGYTCNICNKVFAIRKSLEIHVRYHTGDFPYACKLCDRKFAQACHLNTHFNVKHNKIRFSCEYPNCGKYFTSSSSLRNHEYTHGIMPFDCEYCQQGYPAKSKLKIHIQRKHGIHMSDEQLEKMRKFHVMRSKVNLVQFVDT